MNSTRDEIVITLQEILARKDKGRAAVELQDDTRLIEGLGLDSLDLAVLVVKLEQRLGCDPFRTGREATATLGQLVAVYEQAREKAP